MDLMNTLFYTERIIYTEKLIGIDTKYVSQFTKDPLKYCLHSDQIFYSHF